MTNPLLSVANLSLGFGTRELIRGLSFQVHKGDCIAIIGPNGAGKTALLNALLGSPNVLLFDEPAASLDKLSEERIYELIHSLQKDAATLTRVLRS